MASAIAYGSDVMTQPHTAIDDTHEATLRSWVDSANGHGEFPLQNLPIGIFSPGGHSPRGGVAIGEMILDLGELVAAGFVTGAAAEAARAAASNTLNAYLALTPATRMALRQQLSALLRHDSPRRSELAAISDRLLHVARDCAMHLPAHIGNFTDGMSSLHHVTRAGRQVRPESPVFPNFRHLPVAYHSRASSVRVSGTRVVRPNGQWLAAGQSAPRFGPSEALDYETEVAIWIAGENALGEPVPIDQAAARIAGLGLLNDWSARDIQRWETQPLGPFLGKSFHTTVSPWIVSSEALAPFRAPLTPRAAGDPAPLPYLTDPDDQARGCYQMEVETWLLTPRMRTAGQAPQRLARASLRDLYWSRSELIAHHTCNGCNLLPGDLIGTGTASGPAEADAGCLLELTERGQKPLTLANGEQRAWLLDGDELIIRAHCQREGFVSIGFGECRGMIAPAPR
jgi:fumarylacetoacetase